MNAKGLVTSATSLTADDIPWLDASKLATGILPVARGGTGNTIGQAATAVKLASPRTLAIAGDATGSAAFDGSANANITVTLANTGVADGTYTKVRVNPKGLVIGATTLTTADIPALDASKVTSGMFADARLPWYAQGLCISAPITEDPNITNIPLILTNHANGPISGQYFYITTMMYNQRNGNAAQIAVRYAANAEMYVRYMYNEGNKRGAWSPWKRCDVGGAFAKEADAPLGDNVNLNFFDQSGWVYQPSDRYAQNGSNYPTPKAGRLIIHRANDNFVYQTYQTYDGLSFYRCRYAGSWMPWRRIWDDASLNWSTLPGKPSTFPPSTHVHSTASRGVSGWYKNNDTGVIFQWVNLSIGDHPGGVIDRVVTFPIAFPNACLHVVPTVRENGRPAIPASTVTVAEKARTATNCTIVSSEYIGNVQNFGINVFAIGY
ncbi:gp53-like domain-containing protein [Pseudomonas aeruginosa]|uniref:gp53-like domain-containing protein n=1 Tax=Pseudomonas aeruginosa TaxID=287 RepID=UPI002E2A0680|nr:hypothetical protein [Pseudomonas aeruginosa]